MLSAVLELMEQDDLNFGQLEQLTWTTLMEAFQQVMVQLLEELDKYLLAKRDQSRYLLKDRKQRTLQTLVGEVTFTRRYYWDREQEQWCFLLDEALELESHDRVGPGLLKLAVTWAARGPSYRDARDRLTDLYGAQVLSHESIRQALLHTAAVIERQEANEVVSGTGEREVAALFLEADGFMVSLQGGGHQEAKLVVVHEGWERRQGQGRRADYQLVNAQHLVFWRQDQEDLWEQVRGYLASRYANLESIPVIINGDGAPWIGRGAASFVHGFYQYDRYHLARRLREALRHDRQRLQAARQALRHEDVPRLLITVTEAEQEAEDEQRREKLTDLREVLVKHHRVIRDYRQRLTEAGFTVNSDWRTMGAAESNVDRFKDRTGKHGRAWCLKGARGMLTALSKLFAGRLADFVTRQLETLEDWTLEHVEQGAGYIARSVTRPSRGVRKGHFPATDRGTQGYAPLFRDILRLQSP
jgi:hypothetical protein